MESRNKTRRIITTCDACHLCLDMPNTPVPGEGPVPNDIMIIGEAPGRTEAELVRPFVGKCGKFLRQCIDDHNANPYITNVVKCRPVNGNKDRPPTDEEISFCKRLLWMEMLEVKPKVVCLLGKTACKTLLHDYLPDRFLMKDVVGKEFRTTYLPGAVFIPNYHPSYIIARAKNKEGLFREVIKKVML